MKKPPGLQPGGFFLCIKKPQRGSWGFNGIAQTGEGCATPLFTFPARQGGKSVCNTQRVEASDICCFISSANSWVIGCLRKTPENRSFFLMFFNYISVGYMQCKINFVGVTASYFRAGQRISPAVHVVVTGFRPGRGVGNTQHLLALIRGSLRASPGGSFLG